MTSGPSDLYAKVLKIIKAWSLLRPNKTFGGFTLEGFKTVVATSGELREQIAASDANTQRLIGLRNDADVITRKATRRVVSGVTADGDEGEDGELYAAMGYMTRATRSGLQSASRAKKAELTATDKEENT